MISTDVSFLVWVALLKLLSRVVSVFVRKYFLLYYHFIQGQNCAPSRQLPPLIAQILNWCRTASPTVLPNVIPKIECDAYSKNVAALRPHKKCSYIQASKTTIIDLK